ncbi:MULTISPECIES: DNA repair protein RadA [Rhodomicrobium]|uniref:DNA repair protein RadA n=1 Tax=Rhodomicrobium TaxID=1068 RepID=UPI000B4C0485|nr:MULTISPECIES: DNA repair protein RadA [Rhodomicrobium]
MVKAAREFVCQSCGSPSPRWSGRCAACGEWNTLTEESGAASPLDAKAKRRSRTSGVKLETLNDDVPPLPRLETGIGEFDRVIGGGLAPGSAILLAGDPGIGKSTLLLQLAARLASAGKRAIYFSGEEAAQQIRMRAKRLGVSEAPVELAAETNTATILSTLEDGTPPELVVIDSIQTLWTDMLDAAPGTVSQVRASVQALISYAKRRSSSIILVGHVTKDGQIAGPKVVEHMVDTVLYFEGDNSHLFRLLRSVKNRFGPANEVSVFEMGGTGLREVTNPSELFLGDRDDASPGAAVFAGVEGTRPILVEIQALVAPSPFAAPRRAVVGWDANRLSMILAVLDARCGFKLGAHDIYLNVAGGLRISEPAADVAVAAALLSAHSGVALGGDSVYFGEASLSGAIRPVSHAAMRLKEAQKLGFTAAAAPAFGDVSEFSSGLRITPLRHLSDLAARFIRDGGATQSRKRPAVG